MEEDVHSSSEPTEKMCLSISEKVSRRYGSIHIEPEKKQPLDCNTIDTMPSRRRSYMAVAVLCYVNLLNYMDRYTIAGKGSLSTHKS